MFGIQRSALTLIPALLLSACIGQRVESKSEPTPASARYSDSVRTIRLRPTDLEISIPSNQLWYVHTNEISRGHPQNEPYVGLPWDRAEIRLLLPNFETRTQTNESAFHQEGGKDLFVLTIMMPQGFDGDTRRQWKVINLIPVDEAQAHFMELLKQDERVKPARLIQRDELLGLDEYDGKDDRGSRYFTDGDFVVRCWRRPFSTIRHVCESSFNLPSGLLVNFEFPRTNLSEWRTMREQARQSATAFRVQKKARSWWGL